MKESPANFLDNAGAFVARPCIIICLSYPPARGGKFETTSPSFNLVFFHCRWAIFFPFTSTVAIFNLAANSAP